MVLKDKLIEWLLGGGIALLASVIPKLITNIVESYYRIKHIKVHQKIVQLYDVMANVIDNTSVDRFTIVQVKNGGGMPSVSSAMSITVLHEYFDPPTPPIKRSYQNIVVSKAYSDMLIRIFKEKQIKIKAKDTLPPLVQAAFDQGDIQEAVFFEVKFEKKQALFAGLSSATSINTKDMAVIKTAIARIKNLL